MANVKERYLNESNRTCTGSRKSVAVRNPEEAAVRTIIRWTGEDPERDGLIETPARVTRSLEEFFAGYAQDPVDILKNCPAPWRACAG